MNLYNQLIWYGKKWYRLYQQKRHSRGYYENKLQKGHDAFKIFQILRGQHQRRYQQDTNLDIWYKPHISLGAYLVNVQEHLTFPNYIVNNRRSTIFLYKKKLGNFKMKIELHFLHGQLVYFSYRFLHLSTFQKSQLQDRLTRKYLPGKHVKWNNVFVQDRHGNTLMVEDQINFVIHYHASGLPIFQKLIHKQFALQKKHELRRKQQFSLLHQLL